MFYQFLMDKKCHRLKFIHFFIPYLIHYFKFVLLHKVLEYIFFKEDNFIIKNKKFNMIYLMYFIKNLLFYQLISWVIILLLNFHKEISIQYLTVIFFILDLHILKIMDKIPFFLNCFSFHFNYQFIICY